MMVRFLASWWPIARRRTCSRRTAAAARPYRVAFLLALAGALAGTERPAEAYRFRSSVGPAAAAERWAPEDFPLRFHLQDNLPEFLEETEWRTLVRRALGQWSGIRTAEIDLRLQPGLVAPAMTEDGADAEDGVFTIGWLPEEEEDEDDEEGPITLAYAWTLANPTRRMVSCDIVIGNAFQRWIDADSPREAVVERLHRSLLHEIGHCLGLSHTEPHPVPRFVFGEALEAQIDLPASPFGADTVMSYARLRIPELTEDDVVGVSLLYPARRYLEGKGAVSGILRRDSDPVSYAYVQAVYPGSRPRMGPGAFANAGGVFRLEGLDPGPVLLWVHPILVQDALAHEPLLNYARDEDVLDVLDQWQWVRVEEGTIVGVPPFELSSGRAQ